MQSIGEAIKAGATLKGCCNFLMISVRTIQRWRKAPLVADQRKGPKKWEHKFTKSEEQEMLSVANSLEFKDLTPNQFVPMLADRGIYLASERSFYRLLKKKKMNKHRGRGRAKMSRKPLELHAVRPNEVWSWDITYLKSGIKGHYYFLYLIMDIYSRAIVGWEVHEEQNCDHSSKLIERSCAEQRIKKGDLALHSDNGGPMKGATMLSTLQRLGVIPSFNRPSVSSDNPFSESLFKTLKYVPSYPEKGFESLQITKEWVEKFVRWYNYNHLHSQISFVTPMDRHEGSDEEILNKRREVYTKAKRSNPLRWKKGIRNWEKISIVSLNPEKIMKDYYQVA